MSIKKDSRMKPYSVKGQARGKSKTGWVTVKRYKLLIEAEAAALTLAQNFESRYRVYFDYNDEPLVDFSPNPVTGPDGSVTIRRTVVMHKYANHLEVNLITEPPNVQ